MNFYKIDIGYDCEESVDGVAYETTFLTHKDRLNDYKFREICVRAKEDCIRKYEYVCLYNMVLILTELYGFEKIELTSSWEC